MNRGNAIDCCQCEGIDFRFDQEYVTRKLDEYHRLGPKQTTQMLIDALVARGVEGLTVLDIGGGIGDVIHGLMRAGVVSATNVEASQAYAHACEQEAARLGHADKLTIRIGNFLEVAPELSQADIVTLDRVICCFHDYTRLVGASLSKASQYYGAVYPRDTWWVKASNAIFYNLRFWLQKTPFRTYIHPGREIDSMITGKGFENVYQGTSGTWQVFLYSRS